MVIMSWSCRWILTSFLTPIIVQSSLLNLINAQNLDYPSVVYPPLSWLNVLSYNGSLEAAGVKPILLNGNFVCGFHCIHQTPETCFFAISFLNTSFAASTADYSNQIVWSANRNNPVQLEAELKFTQQGNLVLQDAHGALVWSTDTRAARSQEEDMHLVNLLKRKAEEGQLEDLVDKHGDEMQSNAAEVVETMKVAACCLQSEIKRRPSMSTVVKVLESSKNIEDSLSFDFSNLLEPEAVASDSLTLASSLSGPR
ncbi:hypothetical protein COLO4_33638 [Corchorus olitorius]|uniref:Bulb-type lectin domain-containing protein n=1 Tax=Corchorus olitorius TaxID=93759 RepID=A0A1R3GSF9_9ROSI|nr:hypothetical protein COLO4_33638 [Corchorus olitorius]